MTATVVLPRLLEPVVGDRRRIELEAATVGEAIEALLSAEPGLRVHLFDESGQVRPHVHCFIDGEPSRLTETDAPLTDGTEIVFIQAVSGGGTPQGC